MANEKHLEILKKGTEAWNSWRKQHPDLIPDLTGARLIAAHLSGVDFSDAMLGWADFERANLSLADLSRADLHDASFTMTNLHDASLCSARLSGADFKWARLVGADLRGAGLRVASFCDADLSEANFERSEMSSTLLVDVDLRFVRGLEAVRHRGPSTIGIDTIYLSEGHIPESFLRGAGVPEPFIANMKALVAAMEPIQFYSCFISYSTKDQEFADLLYSQLQSKGARVWLATEDLKIGDRFRARIDEAIRMYDKLLLVLSQDSVKSPWVASEVEAAFEKERKQKRTVLFPIRLDDAVMETDEAWAAEIRRTRHIGDFRKWKEHDEYQKAFARLMRDLKAEEKRPD